MRAEKKIAKMKFPAEKLVEERPSRQKSSFEDRSLSQVLKLTRVYPTYLLPSQKDEESLIELRSTSVGAFRTDGFSHSAESRHSPGVHTYVRKRERCVIS